MRYYKKCSLFLCILAISCLAWASENAISVKFADLVPTDDYFQLNADFDISLDGNIEEAVNRGVALTFLVEFQIVEPREYWFDDELVTISKPVKLSFHALTKQYLVSDDAHQKSFESLREALQQLSKVRDWRVAAKRQLDKDIKYRAAILMRLDKTKLPKAIQVDALGSESWNMVSPIYTWPVK